MTELKMYDGTYYEVKIGQRPGSATEFVGYLVTNKQTGVTEDFSTRFAEANEVAKQMDEWLKASFETEKGQDSGNLTIVN